MAIRWLLLKLVAKSLGLKVGLQAWKLRDWPAGPRQYPGTSEHPVLIVLSADDKYTLQAMAMLANTYSDDAKLPKDGRRHVEWTH